MSAEPIPQPPAASRQPERGPVPPRRRLFHVPAEAWALLAATASGYSRDRVPRLSAALAYFTLFSLAPLLIIVIAIAGLVFGEDAARGQIVYQVRDLIGQQGAEAIQTLLANVRYPASGIAATILGIVTLLVGATGAFAEVQDALNNIWGVVPKPGNSIVGVLKVRLTSFVMVLGTGFLLLVSLVLSAALNALAAFLSGRLAIQADLMEGLNVIVTFAIVTLLFALIFRVLPDADIAWRDVWIGGAITSALFSFGKSVIGIYLGRSSVTSAYGAAGSIVVLLLWVYYSATILYVGAEFTRAYAERYGSGISATHIAVKVDDVVNVEAKPAAAGDGSTERVLKEEARKQVQDAARKVE